MKEKEKKLRRILRIFMTLLTCILIALFFGIMVLVSDMQGTARVVNYAGLVRGKTQQIIKLEKAKELGVSIISTDDFEQMISLQKP